MASILDLIKYLPNEYKELCRETGALKRLREIKSAADLMLLALVHLFQGCSLIEVSVIAKAMHIGNISDVAFMKRFEKCGPWFAAICKKLKPEPLLKYKFPKLLQGFRLLVVDASDVTEKGRSKRTWRLHYALNLNEMNTAQHVITTNETGESLRNFTFQEGDLILGDRIYSTLNGMEHAEAAGARYVLRMRSNSFTLRNAENEKVDLLSKLAALEDDECADYQLFATNAHQQRTPVRICAMRKDADAIAESQKRIKSKESRKQMAVSEETKELNEYIIVVTNLPPEISAKEILGLYRLRWQVEMRFKMFKSLLQVGEMPKRKACSIEAWLNGKIMLALLLELVQAHVFSPLCP